MRGLSDAEAESRLRAEGPNALPRSDRRTIARITRDVLREPMLALLLAGGLVYLALGDLKEALILLVFATFSVVITLIQESRTEKVLDALRDLTSPRALVIRDGLRKRIAGTDVVRGDLIVLSEGDRVPADGQLLEARDLQTDESMLTGESIPVRKLPDTGTSLGPTSRIGGDDTPFVFSGTMVVRGAGMAVVTATGPRSEVGRIGASLAGLSIEPPRLQVQTRRVVILSAVGGGAVSLLVVLIYGLLRGGWLEGLLAGIALGMAMLPEEFPVVLTVFMAMGAWRISRARVLTRRGAAIETLGSATVLCTDKTGTLTQNRMAIAELRLPNGAVAHLRPTAAIALDAEFRDLVQVGVLASAREPFDPMEKAFHALHSAAAGDALTKWDLVRAYGLQQDLLAVTRVWRAPQATSLTVAAKGAPEAIAGLCGLAPDALADLETAAATMAREGLRVLGVALAQHPDESCPDDVRGYAFRLVGLVGLADPLREGVPQAVAECHAAGIRVVMITGDHPVTARAISEQAGIDARDVLTGDDLQQIDDAELRLRVRATSVFARIAPTQKLRIVNALKANGEIVGMTGDGVNDAPALKAAHIGIAMGGRGTDVAREAAAIVLLDDDFGSIVGAIRLGRRIYDNLRKAMAFIFAVHVPIAGLALLPLVLGLPILLGPIHIALLEMVIDPVCSLVFEAETEEADVMQRPPRRPDAPLFSLPLIGWGLLQGALALVLVAAVFIVALQRGMPENEVRALAYVTLVLVILSLVLVNRSFSADLMTAVRRGNRALGLVLLAVAAFLGTALAWPAASALLRFGPLHGHDLALTAATAAVALVILEMAKPLWRKWLTS